MKRLSWRERCRVHLMGKHKIVSSRWNGRYQVSHDEMYRLMGLDSNRHLPEDGTPWMWVVDGNGTRHYVRVLPKSVAAEDARRRKQSFAHRVVARCNGCNVQIPYSRLQQHICKGDR